MVAYDFDLTHAESPAHGLSGLHCTTSDPPLLPHLRHRIVADLIRGRLERRSSDECEASGTSDEEEVGGPSWFSKPV